MVRTHASTAGSSGLIPGWGTKIRQAGQCSQHTHTHTHVYIYIYIHTHISGFPDGSVLKNLPASAGDIRDVDSILLAWEDSQEEEMATHSSILAMDRGTW